jgi:hypothetical protein
MLRAEVAEMLVVAVIEAICAAAFPGEELLDEITRYRGADVPHFLHAVAQNLVWIAGVTENPAVFTAALSPLMALIQDDLEMSALLVKQAAG